MSVIEISDELASVMRAKAPAQGLSLHTWLKKLVAEEDSPETPQEEAAKLEWLRAAAREGLDAAERGDFVALDSDAEIAAFMRQIHEEVKLEVAVERGLG